MVDVFISYKRDERERCERIAEKLRALELDVWFDARLTAGQTFDAEIEETLQKASVVLVLWSRDSVQSEWVRNEATVGKRLGKLAAAQISPCEIPVAFATTHYVSLHNPTFSDDDAGWQSLVRRVGELTRRPGLASYSTALAEAQSVLSSWARDNPSDPLAVKAIHIVEGLASQTVGSRPKFNVLAACLLTATLLSLSVWFGAGILGWSSKIETETVSHDASRDFLEALYRTFGAAIMNEVYYLPDSAMLNIARFAAPLTVVLAVLYITSLRTSPGVYRVYK